jgi:DNA-binding NarL/FixJ family response regulator
MLSPVGDASRSSTILIVDDDVPFCRAAAELLADRGFRVLGYAATARDAVAESRRLRPDGILLDVQLPDGYGVTLVSERLTVSGSPRIVLMSSDPAAVSPEQLQRSGASGFIPKAKLVRSDLESLFNGTPPDSGT